MPMFYCSSTHGFVLSVTFLDHPPCHTLFCHPSAVLAVLHSLDRTQLVHTSLLLAAQRFRCILWHITKKRWPLNSSKHGRNSILHREEDLRPSVSSSCISLETGETLSLPNTFTISRPSGENQTRGNPRQLLKHFCIDSSLRYKAVSEMKSPLTQALFFIIMHL